MKEVHLRIIPFFLRGLLKSRYMLMRLFLICALFSTVGCATSAYDADVSEDDVELPVLEGNIKLVSPSSRYVLSVRKDESSADNCWSVVLTDRKNSQVREIHKFQRRATAAWSPQSKRFFINDFFADDACTCFIFSMDDIKHPIELAKEMRGNTDSPPQENISVQGLSWYSADILDVTIYGSGDCLVDLRATGTAGNQGKLIQH